MNQPSAIRDINVCCVTGATGFVGSHLALTLAQNKNITVQALVRNPEKPIVKELRTAGVHIFEGDITQPESFNSALDNADTVFHAAAILGPAHIPPDVYRAINADAVQKLIKQCRLHKSITRFVHVSSVGVLGPLPPKQRADEGTPPRPQDIYEITKLEGEEHLLAAAENGFPGVAVRPGWVYGPRDTRTLRLFRMIARRRFLMIGNADNKQHPVYIDDLVDGIIKAAQIRGIDGRVYHLCGPDVLTVNDLCQTVANAAGVSLFPIRPPVWTARTPAWLIGKLWSLFGSTPPIDHRKADFFIINRAYSIQRAKKELDWIPKTRFKDGIEHTIDWYKNHGLL
jgi:2-alkyl-3-oxoalkanoate reductase